MKKYLENELSKIKNAGLQRSLRVIAPGILNFSTNNYLSLSEDPRVRSAAAEAAQKYGAGGTSSRLIAGTTDLHAELETALASFKRTEAALVYPSGFQTNIGVISALLGEGDCVIMDKLNHASLWDAAKLSKARVFVYEHRDMDSLDKVLARTKEYKKKLVVTDSLFSMDGDLAQLDDIAALANQYGCWTMTDEAHSTGIFSENGKIDIIMGTLSKALGSQGGFVCGSKDLIEFLVNKSRSFIYTTALAPACAGAALESIKIIREEPGRGKSLLERSAALRAKLKAKGFDTLDSESQIIPVMTGDVAATLALSDKLLSKGIFVPAIRPPTVPEGKCRLRVSLTYSHTEEDIDKLLTGLSCP
jgi:8-amino-7-oxononanoate synthase